MAEAKEPTLVGICGSGIGCGKTSLAEALENHFGFHRRSFAGPIKQALIALDPSINYNQRREQISTFLREGIPFEHLKRESIELRGLLQRMGTEVGRNLFGENFWVDQAFHNIQLDTRTVFDDIRFTQEAYAILYRGGILVHVHRGDQEGDWTDGKGRPEEVHVSESQNEVLKALSHLVIGNDSDLEALETRAIEMFSNILDLSEEKGSKTLPKEFRFKVNFWSDPDQTIEMLFPSLESAGEFWDKNQDRILSFRTTGFP